ncbi:FixH family protein [Polycladidibacter stylochi]|uniref:FixH family protein n=1 Tax=Polycladidibacter stylochi TaxID=1807766 RepID=UPI00082F6345|nr:FixH family protein [Pseudovibrio stylochi]
MSVQTGDTKSVRPFTGKKALLWFLGFFAVIFAVNFTMVYMAIGSFPGLEVASSYKVSQRYNEEIAQARAQEELGWQVDVSANRTNDSVLHIKVNALDKYGTKLNGETVDVKLNRLSDKSHDKHLVLAETSPGIYEGVIPEVANGLWYLHLSFQNSNDEVVFRSRNKLLFKADNQE